MIGHYLPDHLNVLSFVIGCLLVIFSCDCRVMAESQIIRNKSAKSPIRVTNHPLSPRQDAMRRKMKQLRTHTLLDRKEDYACS
jgi:hypothetical protein